jgi:uncharacterized FAD-dependent dehydrogenase
LDLSETRKEEMKKKLNIELSIHQANDDELIKQIAAKKCHVAKDSITGIDYLKRSLDVRGKKFRYHLQMEVYANEPFPQKEIIKEKYREVGDKKQVLIVGAGPAGYFAALELLEFGIKPVIFERGKDVRARRRDIRNLQQEGLVNPDSNYCFGEGGAGAYSDGKLYTRSKKRGNIRKVLQILVEHGGNPDILVDAHPHIGSNKLPKIITKIRETILEHGGEIFFESRVTDIIKNDRQAFGLVINEDEEVFGDAVILATGHSARDIYYLFDKRKIHIEAKPFAIGFRIEHPRELIDTIQYGENFPEELPTASYSLATQVGKSGVYSFCMCPGGIIVPSATNQEELVVNGMSMSRRNSKYSNSGIVSSVTDEDFVEFNKYGELRGMKFQESLEKKFYLAHKDNLMKAPAQKMTDFIEGKESKELNGCSYIPGLVSKDLTKLFTRKLTKNLQRGLLDFGKKMHGYHTETANVVGIESRTSSPVRITRDKETFAHLQLRNLFPCGEGAGYAGGIVSSAADGQNAAAAAAKMLGK